MYFGKFFWDMVSGKYGVIIENVKCYIDFVVENNIGVVLVEGWNIGWEYWIGFEDWEGVFDFVMFYEDYDLEEVVCYVKEKGVEMIMYYEILVVLCIYEQ